MTYGNLMNRIMEGPFTEMPMLEVGDGVTITMFSDRHAATVIDVSPSGKTVTVREDTAIRTDTNGMSDAQEYRYERNLEGAEQTFRWSTKRKKFSGGSRGGGLIGGRKHYYDYSF